MKNKNVRDQLEKKYTTTFLGDAVVPSRIILLKRRADAAHAPNLYTGVGGKIELGETPAMAAVRELEEETGLKGIEVREFYRCIVNHKILLCYFFGVYPKQDVPPCNAGTLEWVCVEDAHKKDLIPTLHPFFQEWQRRSWAVNRPFTLYLERQHTHNAFDPITSVRLQEGLHF